MTIVVNEWIKSVRKRVREEMDNYPRYRKTLKKIGDKRIRNAIYDYLDDNIYTDTDGKEKIKVVSSYTGETAVLTVLGSDGDFVCCEENEAIRENLTFNAILIVAEPDEVIEKPQDAVTLKTFLGFKKKNNILPYNPVVSAPRCLA